MAVHLSSSFALEYRNGVHRNYMGWEAVPSGEVVHRGGQI